MKSSAGVDRKRTSWTALRSGLSCTVFLALLSCASPSDQREAEGLQSWQAFRDQFIEESFRFDPPFAVDQGRHAYDGKLPDWTRQGLKKRTDYLKESRKQAARFSDAELNTGERFERQYLLAKIDEQLFWLEESQSPFKNPTFYALDPDVYLTREYAPLDVRMRAYNQFARNIPAALEKMRQNLTTPLPQTFVQIGRIRFGGMIEFLQEDVPGIFSTVKDTALQDEFRHANAAAIEGLKATDQWFQAQEKTATQEFALGAELFSRMLKATEGVDLPLNRLEEMGREDLKRNLEALQNACRNFASGKTVAECTRLAQLKKPKEGPVARARRQLEELKKFVQEKQLVSIPGPEEARVAEAPPYMRWNFAYIRMPGPFEKGLPSIYYVAPPDPSWSVEERQDYLPGETDLLFVSIHEVWPGHFLHFLHANRSPLLFGRVFAGYAFTEGWAHYAEELMWEAGLGQANPEVHIGQLLNALLRNVRFLSALGLHTRKMGVADSERMFREQAFTDAAEARQQAARGTFDPAYLNYTLGKLMIRKLRDDWCSERGGRQAWRDFHDRFLSFGGPPLPLVRQALLGPQAGPPL
ncbi:MAG: DUF885 domain-containing protein [Acidobacteria bacterium]|nr:DUF885 domain-containing protein [Acidobacteriota bacterium]